ncbi:MAG: amidohydrolase family protein [Chloroflexi bacterium]|nr:amidohydrolase family protein [Chloroflexota bacterium]
MSTLKLPGLIDPHVHLREPGATHKEDWHSGTAAALAGGFTCVLDMPNNTPPITDADALRAKQRAASEKAVCDYGIHFGAGTDNVAIAASLASQVTGLKMYLDQTFGPLRLDGLESLVSHSSAFPKDVPVLCHAEGRTVAAAIFIAHLFDRSVHICHVSRKDEIELIRKAKEKGIRVTCEVTPHHLFLTLDDCAAIGVGRCEVRPMLATRADVEALRANLDSVDCFATDHAPHTLEEKDSPAPPPGYPGLETALALYLELVREDILTFDDVIARCYENPRRIFNVPAQEETWIEVDTDAEWIARGAEMQTRAKWTPFEGRTLRGKVTRVVLRGQVVFENGCVLAKPGRGRNVRPEL